MKTVGIFGDSFADCTYLSDWATTLNNIGPGWPELLALEYKVTNFAAGGSGIYYSYDLFKKMQSDFDIIVFVPSQASRFSIFLPDIDRIQHIVPGFLISQSERQLKNSINNPTDTKVLNAAIGYISYILNEDKEEEMKRLMIEEIKRVRPDTIFIPAFTEDTVEDSISMFELCNMEILHYRTPWDTLRRLKNPLTDARKCHMTEGNNRLVFNKVVDAIENKSTFVRISKSEFVPPTDSFKKYFVYLNGQTNI